MEAPGWECGTGSLQCSWGEWLIGSLASRARLNAALWLDARFDRLRLVDPNICIYIDFGFGFGFGFDFELRSRLTI